MLRPRPSNSRCATRCELVVAYCDEDLSWLVAKAPQFRRTFLYSKCGSPIDSGLLAPIEPILEVIIAPNVGSNDFAVLQHIVRRYYTLAPLTVFCEAGLHALCHMDTVARPVVGSYGAQPYAPILHEFMPPANLSSCLRAREPQRACRVPEVDATYVFADRCERVGEWRAPRKWATRAGSYHFQHSPRRRFDYVLSGFANLSSWLSHTAGPALAAHLLAGGQRLVLGGFFAAESANLLRYPHSLYASMASQQRHPNAEIDHFIERTWGLLLTTPTDLPPSDLPPSDRPPNAMMQNARRRDQQEWSVLREHERAMAAPDVACPPSLESVPNLASGGSQVPGGGGGADTSGGAVAYVLLTNPFERPRQRSQGGMIEAANVLRLHVLALAELRTTMLRRLLIMVPTDPLKRAVPGYLDVSAELSRLPFKVSIEHVANNSLGSYGMYFEAFARVRSTEEYGYYVFSEDDYVPYRAHFDAILVRMHMATFGTGHGLLCGVLQGRPVEPSSRYPLHPESSHIMSSHTLAHLFAHTYERHGWVGELTWRGIHLLARERRDRPPRRHRTAPKYGYYDSVQLAVGALMRDAGIPMRDWTSAYRTPYWNHDTLVDWSGAGHDFRVPLERVLFVPVQWLYAREMTLCCRRFNCKEAEAVARAPIRQGPRSCVAHRHQPEGAWSRLSRRVLSLRSRAPAARLCCITGGDAGEREVSANFSVPAGATDVLEALAAMKASAEPPPSLRGDESPADSAQPPVCSLNSLAVLTQMSRQPTLHHQRLSTAVLPSTRSAVEWRTSPPVVLSPAAAAQAEHGCGRCKPQLCVGCRAVLCVFGVVPRGIRSTWPTMKENVMDVLRAHGYATDLYVFNLDTGPMPIDGTQPNRSDVQLVPSTVFESARQADADRQLVEQCRGHWQKYRKTSCSFWYYSRHSKVSGDALSKTRHINAMRQLYSERAVGRFLRSRGSLYDVAIVCSADLYLTLPLHIVDVLSASASPRAVWTSSINDAGNRSDPLGRGYTNAFYVGRPAPLHDVLTRLDDVELWSKPNYDYEVLLRRAFEARGVERRVTPMVFFKVRANGNVDWGGGRFGSMGSATSVYDREHVITAYKALQRRLRAMRARV